MGTPKSSILVGIPITNHPFWGTPILGNLHMEKKNMFQTRQIYTPVFLKQLITGEGHHLAGQNRLGSIVFSFDRSPDTKDTKAVSGLQTSLKATGHCPYSTCSWYHPLTVAVT